MIRSQHPLDGARTGFFGKGGSGKSTLLVLVARELARAGYDVYVLDADSTNVGLHQALEIADPPAPLLDYFGGMVFSGGRVTCPVDDPTLLVGATIAPDRLPPRYSARTPDGITFMAAGKLAGTGPGAGCDGPLVKIARDLTIRDGDHPVLLVDFKAGFEDTARGAITSLDYAIVVVDPTQAALQMAIHMRDMVRAIHAGGLPATHHLAQPELVAIANRLYREARIKEAVCVLNKVTDEATEETMRTVLAEAGLSPLGVVYDDPAITRAWLRGEAIDGGQSRAAADVAAFTRALQARVAQPVP